MEVRDLGFFLGTLFVPQTSSSPGNPHPLVSALLASAAESTSSTRPNGDKMTQSVHDLAAPG